MDRLPQEIIDLIVFFLTGGPYERSKRAQYVTISKKFLAVIERSTFKSLRIKSNELKTFAQYLKPCRQGFLRTLTYDIILPEIDTAVSERFKRPSETEAVSKLFSHHVKDLFDTLHRLNGLSGICLHIKDVDNEGFGSSRRMCSPINLFDPEALPQLKCILHLSTGEWNCIPAPGISVDLAARMTGLARLDLLDESGDIRYPGLLREDRHSLATMLKMRSDETKTVSETTLNMTINGDVTNQMLSMPNLTYPMGYDSLGSSLRIWSQRLTAFWFGGVIDETLFWPHALETETATPKWPNLEHFIVRPERHTPSGWWYFTPKGNPNYGTRPRNPAEDPYDLPQPFTDNPTYGADPFDSEEEENWDYQPRNVPNEDTMQPLVEGWAKALQCMPSLRRARLSFEKENYLDNDEENKSKDWGIIYEGPGFHISTWKNLRDGERSSRRLIFRGTGGWRPNNDTMDLLRRIGEDSHPGTKLVVLDNDRGFEVTR